MNLETGVVANNESQDMVGPVLQPCFTKSRECLLSCEVQTRLPCDRGKAVYDVSASLRTAKVLTQSFHCRL